MEVPLDGLHMRNDTFHFEHLILKLKTLRCAQLKNAKAVGRWPNHLLVSSSRQLHFWVDTAVCNECRDFPLNFQRALTASKL
jgi:hypothetical protein